MVKAHSERNREKEQFLTKIKELERKVQNQTANEIGEGAEIDLYDDLRNAFNDDDINRTEKFQNGADIVQVVMHKGISCGKIVFDSKNRKAWRSEYAKKLADDKSQEAADHAILTTSLGFPSGKKELCLESGIIVINPARAVTIVFMLRRHMIRLHELGLSIDQRESKMAALYKFMSSESFKQNLEQLGSITTDLLDLEVKEEKQHKKMWAERGRMLKRMERTVQTIDTEICLLMEGADAHQIEKNGVQHLVSEDLSGLFDEN